MGRSCRVFSFLILFGIAALPLAAATRPNGMLAGTVMTPDGRGLVGAVVALFQRSDPGTVVSIARSDQQGAYNLSGVAAGAYSIQVSRFGYQVIHSPRVVVDPGKTTTVNFVLQELVDFISARDDPRNWDLKTVMRSTSDRRLIFRGLPGAATPDDVIASFHRSGALNIVSTDLLGPDNYAVYPNRGDLGVASNFAFVEPVSLHGRMIFSGQLSSGTDALWRVRNTYDYRPNPNQEYKFSVGVGRLSPNHTGTTDHPADFFNSDQDFQDSGVQTLVVGFQGSRQFLNVVAVEYGLDLSRIQYGARQSVWSPYLQVAYTPHRRWLLRTLMSSRRISDNNMIELPGGDVVNLLEPAYISQIDNVIHVSQVRHSEFSVARKLADDTSLELTVYRDRVDGPGTPFLLTTNTEYGQNSQAVQLKSDQDAQQGVRVAFARMLTGTIQGLIAYDYGTAAGLANINPSLSSGLVNDHILDYVQRSYYHSITSQLEAKIPQTRTHVQATVRWYPGNPISSIDLFADRMDTLTKGVSFSLRQALPLPPFMGCPGRWEAQIDVRNPFDQGMSHIPLSDGDLVLTRIPRALRFGLNLNFF
jgi:hypothetical protein